MNTAEPKKRKVDNVIQEETNKMKKRKLTDAAESVGTPKKGNPLNVKGTAADCNAPNEPKGKSTMACFIEDDNYVEFEASNEQEEFPSEDEEDPGDASDMSEPEEGEIATGGQSENNNSNVQPGTSDTNAQVFELALWESFSMMQDFLIHKGILSTSMTEGDMEEFVHGAVTGLESGKPAGAGPTPKKSAHGEKTKIQQAGKR